MCKNFKKNSLQLKVDELKRDIDALRARTLQYATPTSTANVTSEIKPLLLVLVDLKQVSVVVRS